MSYSDFCHFEVHRYVLSEKKQDIASLCIIIFVSVQKNSPKKQGPYTFSL